MNYWLMKSEPETFGIDDLKKRPKQIEPWDGVRNYQARNTLRDRMKVGDQAFFYHSSCDTPGIVGIMEIVQAGYPDSSAFDPEDPHFDPKSDQKNPRWYRVDVRFVRKLKRTISLAELKSHKALTSFPLLQRGSRLSVMPVTPQQWKFILSLE